MFKNFKKILDVYFGKNITENVSYNTSLSSVTHQKRDHNLWTCEEKLNIFKSTEKPSMSINGTELADSSFMKNKSGYIFQRVIIDEVDSISIPAFPSVFGKYIWLITSSINNILYPNFKWKKTSDGSVIKLSNGISGNGFLKNILLNSTHHRRCSWPISNRNIMRIFKTIVRNNVNFINDCMYIPAPIINYIECYTPPSLLAVSGVIDKKALNALNAGDIKTAVSLLGCESGTENDLLNIVNKKLLKEEENIKLQIKDYQKTIDDALCQLEVIRLLISDSIENSGENSELTLDLKSEEVEISEKTKKTIHNAEKAISSWKQKLNNVDNKMNGIKNRISNSETKTCGICASNVVNPGITPCCQNVFCMNCINMALQYSKECPYCRSALQIKNVSVIINDSTIVKDEPENKLPTKIQSLIEKLNKDIDSRVLVFSEYDATFKDITKKLLDNNIKFSQLKGSSGTICNIVNHFKNKEFRVLLLNAKNFGAGLNLQFTDKIIIYHRMSKDIENQVIGRAQRMGRESALNIDYLCYENELPKESEQPVNDPTL
tara:strand:- start:273 stop:1916 length:1644 start_codon:yes stop_codon:yes gene_type:complete